MTIRVSLKEILDSRGIAQTELQSLSGLSYSSINALYHGKNVGIEFGTLDALCKALRVQPGDLLRYVPDRQGGRSR